MIIVKGGYRRITARTMGEREEGHSTIVNATPLFLGKFVCCELFLELGGICFCSDGNDRADLLVELLGTIFGCLPVQVDDDDTAPRIW